MGHYYFPSPPPFSSRFCRLMVLVVLLSCLATSGNYANGQETPEQNSPPETTEESINNAADESTTESTNDGNDNDNAAGTNKAEEAMNEPKKVVVEEEEPEFLTADPNNWGTVSCAI